MLKKETKKIKNKSSGFTLIEIMLVMAVAAVMMTMKLQEDQLEMTQMQARKLGATELFVYNLGVQKYLSSISGIQPSPGDYPKVYSGVDWLKNTSCITPTTATADSDYVPCAFLSTTGGRTTFGSMSFTTTIDYDPASGYTAETVLSKMSGSAAGENNAGVLGLAALVASGAFIGSDASATSGGSGGSIIYCPDISPMPPGMASVCGSARDQIVMIVNTNGANDTWLRVDHGNMMAHVIEFQGTSATPTLDADLSDVHPTMRQIRNVARIYNSSLNASSDPENLYIGNRVGADIVTDSSHARYPTLTENAVIIDADQEVIGRLVVQDGITVNNGGITVENGDVNVVNGSVTALNDIRTLSGNADINGWITAGNDITSSNGNIIADNGEVRSTRMVDSDDNTFILDPDSESALNSIGASTIKNNDLISTTLNMRAPTVDIRQEDGSPSSLTGEVDVSNLWVRKNGVRFTLESLIPNMTFIGSYRVNYGTSIFAPPIWTYCGGSDKTRVFITPLRDTIRSLKDYYNRYSLGNQVRWVERSGDYYIYRARGRFLNPDSNARAVMQFYCYRG